MKKEHSLYCSLAIKLVFHAIHSLQNENDIYQSGGTKRHIKIRLMVLFTQAISKHKNVLDIALVSEAVLGRKTDAINFAEQMSHPVKNMICSGIRYIKEADINTSHSE